MSQVIAATSLEASDGQLYDVKTVGRRVRRRWEGWIEFVPLDGSPVVRTPRETTQPTLAALQHWASGLSPVYLDGALTRARHAARVPHVDLVEPEEPFYDSPAPDPHARPVVVRVSAPAPAACDTGFTDVEGAVLDPFSVYAKGEDVLRQKLTILSADHLRRIARGYRLVPDDADLSASTEVELAALIVAGVRTRCAA